MRVKKIKVGQFDKSILDEYRQDYVIQECIVQHSQYEEFNSSSVNTEKIISFLFKGNVYILTSILRVGAPGSCTDTASTGSGYTVGIGSNGRLNDKGYSIYGDIRYKNANGKNFSDIKLVGHEAICNIIMSAHKMLPRFGIISWDFAVDKCGDPILIEYNLNYPDVIIYQMNNGPLFGNLTAEVLSDVAKRRKMEGNDEIKKKYAKYI